MHPGPPCTGSSWKWCPRQLQASGALNGRAVLVPRLQLQPPGSQTPVPLLSGSRGWPSGQARGVRGVGGTVLPSNMQLESLWRCRLAWKKVRGNWNYGISNYKRSHSELHALLHNKGTRRQLMALKGPELETKGHNFLCFVFWAFRPVPCDGRLRKQATAYPTLPGRKACFSTKTWRQCSLTWASPKAQAHISVDSKEPELKTRLCKMQKYELSDTHLSPSFWYPIPDQTLVTPCPPLPPHPLHCLSVTSWLLKWPERHNHWDRVWTELHNSPASQCHPALNLYLTNHSNNPDEQAHLPYTPYDWLLSADISDAKTETQRRCLRSSTRKWQSWFLSFSTIPWSCPYSPSHRVHLSSGPPRWSCGGQEPWWALVDITGIPRVPLKILLIPELLKNWF